MDQPNEPNKWLLIGLGVIIWILIEQLQALHEMAAAIKILR